MTTSKKVCIYCGANSGNSERIIDQSRILAEDLARAGFDLVYGGGKFGLMGLVADVFMEHGRPVTGIRPDKLIKDESIKEDITLTEVVEDMYIRKARMIELSDVLIALPGGSGTLDEVMDAFSEIKLDYVKKWLGVLSIDDYYAPFQVQLSNMVKNGFLRPEDHDLLHFASSPREMISLLDSDFSNENDIDKLAYIHMVDGQILMTLSKGKKSYYIPGGKRDEGESDHQALIREVKEELTVDIEEKSLSYIGTYRAQADGKPIGTFVKMTCYTASFVGILNASNEIAEIRWMNYSDKELVSHVDKIIFDDLHKKGYLL